MRCFSSELCGKISVMKKDPLKIFLRAEKKRESSKFLEALPLYLEAKTLARKDEDLLLEITCSLADTYRMTGDFTRATVNYRRSQVMSKAHGLSEGERDACVGEGLSQRGMGEHKEAIKIFRKAMKGYEKDKDIEGIAFTLWAMAGAFRIKGDLKAAIDGFKKARHLFAKLSDDAGVGYCLTGLGGASRVAGRHGVSLAYYKKANELFREISDTFGIAYSHCGIANAMRMKGDFKGSLKHFDKARTNYKKIGDRVSYAYTLWGEAQALQITGAHAGALADLKEAEAFFKATKDKRGVIYCRISYAQLDFQQRRRAKAVRTLEAAQKKAAELGLGIEKGYARRVLAAIDKDPDTIPLNLA